MNQFCSIHNHTTFCDGSDDVETMCRAAYEKNLNAIGFSAHAPIEKQIGIESFWNLKDEKVGAYVAEVRAAKERWRGKLKVFLGYEMDYIKGIRSALDEDVTKLNLDYIIGSVHYIVPQNGLKPFTVDGSLEEVENGVKNVFGGDMEAFMNCYYDATLEMIDMGGIDVIGHIDIIKKNYPNKKPWSIENELKRQQEVAKAAAKAGLLIEVNTGGINRKKINELYPSIEFLKIIRELNIPIIITADAHNSKDITGNYILAQNTLIKCNFNEHYIIYGKENDKIIWKKIKL